MLGLSRLLGPFLYPYSRAFPPPHLTIISTISLPNLPFYRPPDSLMASASLEPYQLGDATQQDDKAGVDLMPYFKSLTGKNAINMY